MQVYPKLAFLMGGVNTTTKKATTKTRPNYAVAAPSIMSSTTTDILTKKKAKRKHKSKRKIKERRTTKDHELINSSLFDLSFEV